MIHGGRKEVDTKSGFRKFQGFKAQGFEEYDIARSPLPPKIITFIRLHIHAYYNRTIGHINLLADDVLAKRRASRSFAGEKATDVSSVLINMHILALGSVQGPL